MYTVSIQMVVSLHVVVRNWIFRTSTRSHPPHSLWSALLTLASPCLLWPKDLFIIIHKYTVADFRCTRRGHQISLWVVCEPPCGCWDLNSGPSEEQSVLLTTEPSLQLIPLTSLCIFSVAQTRPEILKKLSIILGSPWCLLWWSGWH